MTDQERISVGAMKLLTEQMGVKEAHEVLQWFWRNMADFQREELAQLCNQLMINLVGCMDNPKEAMDESDVELEAIYEGAYKEMENETVDS